MKLASQKSVFCIEIQVSEIEFFPTQRLGPRPNVIITKAAHCLKGNESLHVWQQKQGAQWSRKIKKEKKSFGSKKLRDLDNKMTILMKPKKLLLCHSH